VGEILGELENLWIERNFNLDRANLVARLEAMVQPS
jgi:poly(A) polymerase